MQYTKYDCGLSFVTTTTIHVRIKYISMNTYSNRYLFSLTHIMVVVNRHRKRTYYFVFLSIKRLMSYHDVAKWILAISFSYLDQSGIETKANGQIP